jgi:hydroxymethylbilane synthase
VSARTLVIGTRGSRLALRQTEIAATALGAANSAVTLDTRTIQTEGDRSTASLNEIGGRGVFVVEIERALLAGEIDIAVHSLKDLPSDETPGLVIAATLPREDVRDVLISRNSATLHELPSGASIGTGSPRRACQLLALRHDVEVRDIRGNVDTRIRKTDEGEYDAIVLAAAGLSRLGWLDRATQVFELSQMLPAVGQGALALQVREDDAEAGALVSAADDATTHVAVTAERAFERRLGGGCHAAIAALATVGTGVSPDRAPVLLRGLVGDPHGRLLRSEMEGVASEAEMLGLRLAEFLIAQGADELLQADENYERPAPGATA